MSSSTKYCPVLRPSFSEFVHFNTYIKSIENILHEYGIVKVIPPLAWNPRHSIRCMHGPGNFRRKCVHKSNDSKNDLKINSENESNVVVYDRSTFGHQTHYNCQINKNIVNPMQNRNNHTTNTRNSELENGKSLVGLFGDDHQDSLLSKLAIAKYQKITAYKSVAPSFITMNNDLTMKQKRLQSSPNLDLLLHSSRSNIERNFKHRYRMHKNFRRIKNVKSLHCIIGMECYLYLFYDRLWYQGVITQIDIYRNSCTLALKDCNVGSCSIDPAQDILLMRTNSKKSIAENAEEKQICECCCPPILANEVSVALNGISSITNWEQMGRLPNNFINSMVSMRATKYEQNFANAFELEINESDFYGKHRKQKMETLKVDGVDVPLAKSNVMDIGLRIKRQKNSLLELNSECEWVADMLIQSPVRQTAYQGNDASTVVYHILNVIETERMTVKHFMQLAIDELKNELRELRGMKDIHQYIENDTIEEHLEEIEREHLRNLPYRHPLYGADSVGSLFHTQQTWNLSHLSTILDLIDIEIHGVTLPYLYFGSWRSLFAWHIEDRALYSINYLHFGKPKVWFAVPPSDFVKMELILADCFKSDSRACPVFTRHKMAFIPAKRLERSVTVYRAIQRCNEFIITAPNCYHSGFNLGFNCAEAVNFATPSWIPIGINAGPCKCGQLEFSVSFNLMNLMKRIEAEYPQLLPDIGELPTNYERKLRLQSKPKVNRKRTYKSKLKVNGDEWQLPPKKRKKTYDIH